MKTNCLLLICHFVIYGRPINSFFSRNFQISYHLLKQQPVILPSLLLPALVTFIIPIISVTDYYFQYYCFRSFRNVCYIAVTP